MSGKGYGEPNVTWRPSQQMPGKPSNHQVCSSFVGVLKPVINNLISCTEVGHRTNCPKLSKLYPFDISSVSSVDVVCDVSYSVNDVWVNKTCVLINKRVIYEHPLDHLVQMC